MDEFEFPKVAEEIEVIKSLFNDLDDLIKQQTDSEKRFMLNQFKTDKFKRWCNLKSQIYDFSNQIDKVFEGQSPIDTMI